ncbi:MAG: DUF5012 domain-containing protein [Bacteroidales bacterium]|nr:DUF5012 domain-containing protein [Bacteroidales bacterium]
MKKLTYITLAVAMIAFCASCEKVDHAKGLRVTYYPSFSLNQGSLVAHQVGTPWVDPGCVATLKGEDISDQLEINGPVDANTSGIYSIEYSFTNEDGFTNSISRTVVVYDVANASSTDISGDYNTSCNIYAVADGSLAGSWDPACSPQKITKGPAKGLFYVQDLFGGRYAVFAGYGSSYAAKALILLNSDNSVSLLDANVAWGPTFSTHNPANTKYDPATSTLTIDFIWGTWGTANFFVCTYSK